MTITLTARKTGFSLVADLCVNKLCPSHPLLLYLTADNVTLLSPNRHSGTASSSRFYCRGAAFQLSLRSRTLTKTLESCEAVGRLQLLYLLCSRGTETVSAVATATVHLSSQTSGQRREMSEICRRFIRTRERGATWLVAEKDV